MNDAYLPMEAQVMERIEESDTIFTLRLQLTDAEQRRAYRFQPGQFNMVYLYGVGEVAISVVSDPEDQSLLNHTIRVVGRVTEGIARLVPGDRLGIRGPYGRGWPLKLARGRNVLVVTGGLGCAPVVSVIHYIFNRRAAFGRVSIVQGVKHSEDLIWRKRYEEWAQEPDTQVLLAADVAGSYWPWHVGLVTELLDQVSVGPDNGIVLMCGPEPMMRNSARVLIERGFAETDLYLTMERNMQCALGHCGHCQYGAPFICREGPVFAYPEIKSLLGVRGF